MENTVENNRLIAEFMGYEIINFYENNKIGVPSLVFIRGEKEYYKPLN